MLCGWEHSTNIKCYPNLVTKADFFFFNDIYLVDKVGGGILYQVSSTNFGGDFILFSATSPDMQ